MEGIDDGRAVDDCFYCALLYPDECAADCPRCGKRMRYRPAALIDEAGVAAEHAERVARYRAAAAASERRRCLIALLELMHRWPGVTGGPDVAELRRAFEALGLRDDRAV